MPETRISTATRSSNAAVLSRARSRLFLHQNLSVLLPMPATLRHVGDAGRRVRGVGRETQHIATPLPRRRIGADRIGLSWPSISGMQVKPLPPLFASVSLPSSPGIITVASFEMLGGAALIASLINSSLDIVGMGLLLSANTDREPARPVVTTATAKTCLTLRMTLSY